MEPNKHEITTVWKDVDQITTKGKAQAEGRHESQQAEDNYCLQEYKDYHHEGKVFRSLGDNV